MFFIENITRREVLPIQFDGEDEAIKYLDECGAYKVGANRYEFCDELFIVIEC